MKAIPFPGTEAWKKEIHAAIMGGKTSFKLSPSAEALDYIDTAEGLTRGKDKYTNKEKEQLKDARMHLLALGVETK